jgi:hypothetical protein
VFVVLACNSASDQGSVSISHGKAQVAGPPMTLGNIRQLGVRPNWKEQPPSGSLTEKQWQ